MKHSLSGSVAKVFFLALGLMAITFGAQAQSYPADVTVRGMTFRIPYVNIDSAALISVDFEALTGVVEVPQTVSYDGRDFTVRRIHNGAFFDSEDEYDQNFTKVILPPTVTAIGANAFKGCYSLTELPNLINVREIGNSAFSYCSGINGRVTLPSNIQKLGNALFDGCSGITYIYYNCLNAQRASSSTTTSPFKGTMSNLKTLEIGQDVQILAVGMFGFCAMNHVILSANVASTGSSMFANCNQLDTVTISANVVVVPANLFGDVSYLSRVNAWSASLVSLGSASFAANSIDTVYVPTALLSAYQGDAAWTGTLNTSIGAIKGTSASRSYSLSVASATAGGSVSGSATGVAENTARTITATPNADYSFMSWDDGNRNATRSVTIVSDMVLKAYFALDTAQGADTVVCDSTISRVCATGQTLTYYLNCDTTATLTGYTGTCTGALTLPDTVMCNGQIYPVTAIGDSAFKNCNGLTGSLTIPNSVISIGDYAFYYCSGFTGTLTIPNSVTSIGQYVFQGCSGFTGTLTIPNSVTSIGQYVFRGCSGFTSLTIGNSLVSISRSAFMDCSGFTGTLTIPNTVTSISMEAFRECRGFTGTLTIPNTVTSIGGAAFYNCRGFTGTLTIPNSVTYIGGWAFRACSGLTGTITIPSSVTTIGYGAFADCSGITSLVVQNGNSVYDSRNNCNAIIETASNTLVSGCQNTIIPSSITSIGEMAFRGCSGLTGTLTIPNSVTSIGKEAFVNCSGLTSFTIPNSVTSIGNEAFRNCSGLTSVTSLATAPPTLGNNVFGGITNTIPVYVPCGSQTAYSTANGWDYFSNIQGQYDSHITETVTACDTFAWHGNIYTTSSTVQDTHTNASGCDSVVTLNLTINNGTNTAYTEVACDSFTWTVTPTGAVDGLFSVGNGQQVYISQGNLQYQASTNTWRFATNQWDYIGSSNSSISSTNSGWIDLFGWGTSGWNSGANCYQPWSTSTSYADYYPGGAYTNNLTGSYANADWGVNNAISNGGNAAGMWRTLTHDEWSYLFNSRTGCSTVGGTSNGRYALAQVNGVGGVIVFPDSYTHPSGVAAPQNVNSTSGTWGNNSYSASDWGSMQTAGAVFLPAAGLRDSRSLYDVGSFGYYWSSSYNNSHSAWDVYLFGGSLNAGSVHSRHNGGSVRLVRGNNSSSTSQTYNTSGTYYRTYTAANGCPSVDTLHLTINHSSAGTDRLSACDSLAWGNGITYFTSNTTDTVHRINAAGCDSLVTLNLTMRYSTTYTDSYDVCDSLRWYNDSLYTASNTTATDTLVNAAGCDSVVTLNLMVNYSTTWVDSIDVCDSLLWYNGVLYTEDNNTDTIHRVNAAGCDSLVTLSLTVRYSTTSIDSLTVCDSLFWYNDVLYTEDNSTDTIHRVNAAGCDSLVTLSLTVNYSSSHTDSVTACDNYTWTDGNGQAYNASGVYTYSHNTVDGCIATDTLHLTINNRTYGTDSITACGSYTWINDMVYYMSNHTDTDTLTNMAGCDSIVTLNLTINYNSSYILNHVAVCDSYIWELNDLTTGQPFIIDTFYSSDTVLFTFYGANHKGCDSIILLPLTVNYSSNSIDTVIVCNSYEWHGTTYTASTDSATFTTTNAAGCDSVVTLNLTLDFDTNSGIDSTVCGQMLWHDSLYTITGTYLNIDTTATGCINTDTLHLTVYYDSSTAYSVTDTDSYTWVNHGDTTTYTQSGTYINDYTTADGCASADTLHLTLISSVNYYTVQVHSANARGGYATIDDTNRVAERQRCTIRAHAYNGYRFVRWNNGSTANPYTFMVTRDTVFVAIFEGTTCTLTVVNGNPGRGTVTGSCTAPYGSRRNISAVPAAGCRFSHWSDGDTNASRSVTLNGNITLTAYFDAQLFHVAALSNDTTQGTVSGGGDYAYIDMATLQATPATGYRFDRWNDGDTANPRRITVMCDSTFTAYFSELRYRIDVVSNDTVQGSVSGGGSYRHMDYATITATPNSGYLFDRWNDGDTTNPRRIQVTADSTFTAYFWSGQQRYTLTVTSANETMGRVSGGGLYYAGTPVTITATANNGYEFVQWNDGVTTNPRTVRVNSDTTFTATFHDVNVPVTYTVTVGSNDRQMGSASGGGTYQAGTSVQLNAYPAARCHFMRWSDGNTSNPRNIVVNSNISLTAIFAYDNVTITVRANNDQMGTVTGGGTYPVNSTATISATANSGYRFVRWSSGETANPLSFTVRYATTYTAIFERVATEGIDGADGTAVRVWGSDRTIHIAGLDNAPVRVYDITGRLVTERASTSGDLLIPVAYPGLYMVQTGTTTHKVLIR